MRHRNRIIVGSAFGLAAIAVAIDHTRHSVPEAQPAAITQDQSVPSSTPCALDSNPCALGGSNPCSLGRTSSPCSL